MLLAARLIVNFFVLGCKPKCHPMAQFEDLARDFPRLIQSRVLH